jgi:hypothetical protein
MSLFGPNRPGAGEERPTDRTVGRFWSGLDSRRSSLPLRSVYLATAEGLLDDHLRRHGELVTSEVVAALEKDLRLAEEYGDLDAAALAAEAAAVIHALLGHPAESVARYLDLVVLQAGRARSRQDLHEVRRSALVIGALGLEAGRLSAVVECLLIVGATDLRQEQLLTAGRRPTEESQDRLLAALRSTTDLAELLAELPPEQQEPTQLRRFVELLGQIWERGSRVDWPAHEVLAVRALLRRASRACSRIVTDGSAARSSPDTATADWVDSALRRLAGQLSL